MPQTTVAEKKKSDAYNLVHWLETFISDNHNNKNDQIRWLAHYLNKEAFIAANQVRSESLSEENNELLRQFLLKEIEDKLDEKDIEIKVLIEERNRLNHV